jgi:hypothetical protein
MLTDDLGAEWYDSSKLSLFMLCPQKYKYRIIESLVGTEPEFALQFGIAIHKGLETIYNGSYNKPAANHDGITRLTYQQAFLDSYPEEPEKGPRTKATGLMLLTAYIQKWQNEPFDVLGVEVPFAMPFNDAQGKLDFYVVGRMDLVIKWNDDVMPVDHKTTRYFGDHFELGFKVDLQPTIYIIATQSGDKQATKAVINAIRVNEKISDDSFVRKITTRTPEELATAKREIVRHVKNIRMCAEREFYPRHGPQACFAYNRTCEYYSLCVASSSQAATLKETAYRREVWQPV